MTEVRRKVYDLEYRLRGVLCKHITIVTSMVHVVS